MEKGEIAQNEQFHLYSTMFSMQSVSEKYFSSQTQLSSVASLSLRLSQNGVLGNGLSIFRRGGSL